MSNELDNSFAKAYRALHAYCSGVGARRHRSQSNRFFSGLYLLR